MNNRTFYNEVLTDHNRYPGHKEKTCGCKSGA